MLMCRTKDYVNSSLCFWDENKSFLNDLTKGQNIRLFIQSETNSLQWPVLKEDSELWTMVNKISQLTFICRSYWQVLLPASSKEVIRAACSFNILSGGLWMVACLLRRALIGASGMAQLGSWGVKPEHDHSFPAAFHITHASRARRAITPDKLNKPNSLRNRRNRSISF